MANRRSGEERHRLAAEAARLLIELKLPSAAAARRKLIGKVGHRDPRQLPDDREIEAAARDYRQLFGGQPAPDQVTEVKAAALEALQALAPFNPRLVEPSAGLAAAPLAAIWLLAFADETEAVLRFLDELGVPLRQRERKLDLGRREPVELPLLTFSVLRSPTPMAESVESAFEVSVLPLDAQRVRLRLPGDDQTLRTFSAIELENEIAAGC